MCMQDLFISRSATIKQSTVTITGDRGKIPANPDRIAFYLAPTEQTRIVQLSIPVGPEQLEYVVASNAGNTPVYDVANSDLLYPNNYMPYLAMTYQTHPGLISYEFIVFSSSPTVYLTEVILSRDVSAAVQSILKQ